MKRTLQVYLATPALLVLAFLVLASNAWAGGSWSLRSPSVNEVSGGWHVFVTITLPSAPSIAHPTLKFLFTKQVVFERDLVDNSPNPVMNRMPLVGQNPSTEAFEVDFADPSGKIWKGTRFDFTLSRVRGYEAGEYKMQIRTSDGVDVGGSAELTLNGDNPVVDRRAMNFDTKDKNMKKVAAVDTGNGPPKQDDVAAVQMSGQVAPVGSAPPFLGDQAFQVQPEELAQHPKGCGCGVAGLPEPGDLIASGGTVAGLWMLLLGRSKKRRKSSPAPRG